MLLLKIGIRNAAQMMTQQCYRSNQGDLLATVAVKQFQEFMLVAAVQFPLEVAKQVLQYVDLPASAGAYRHDLHESLDIRIPNIREIYAGSAGDQASEFLVILTSTRHDQHFVAGMKLDKGIDVLQRVDDEIVEGGGFVE